MQPEPLQEALLLNNRLSDFIGEAIGSGQVPELTWRRLFDDAEKLKNKTSTIAEGYSFQALLHAIKVNRKGWKDCAETAINYGLPNIFYIANIVNCGLLVGDLKFKLDYLKELILSSDNINDIIPCLYLFMERCQFSVAAELYERLNKMEVGEKINLPTRGLINTYKNLNQDMVSESDLLDRLDTAAQLIVDKTHKRITGHSISSVDDGILYYFTVDLPVEKLIEIEWDIIRKLNEVYEDSLSNFISFAVVSPGMLVRGGENDGNETH